MKNKMEFSARITVPDEWIEKALAVPAAHAEKPVVRLNSRRMLSAAVIVLVLSLSLTLYFLFGNKSYVPAVIPSPTVGSTAVPAQDQSEASTEYRSDNSGYETQPPTTAQTHNESPTVSGNTAETSSASPTSPAEHHPTVAPTETLIITATEHPTEPAVIQPTEPPHQEDPTDDIPGIPELPLIERSSVITHLLNYQSSWELILPCEDNVYCRVYDSSGNLLGDPDLYSQEHIAAYYLVNGAEYLYYYFSIEVPADDEDTPVYVTYVFYGRNGIAIAQGSAVI